LNRPQITTSRHHLGRRHRRVRLAYTGQWNKWLFTADNGLLIVSNP